MLKRLRKFGIPTDLYSHQCSASCISRPLSVRRNPRGFDNAWIADEMLIFVGAFLSFFFLYIRIFSDVCGRFEGEGIVGPSTQHGLLHLVSRGASGLGAGDGRGWAKLRQRLEQLRVNREVDTRTASSVTRKIIQMWRYASVNALTLRAVVVGAILTEAVRRAFTSSVLNEFFSSLTERECMGGHGAACPDEGSANSLSSLMIFHPPREESGQEHLVSQCSRVPTLNALAVCLLSILGNLCYLLLSWIYINIKIGLVTSRATKP